MRKDESLFQVGEVAMLCGVTRKMILNYEDLGLLSPSDVDANSGYRYYDSAAISRIQLILDLRRAGMPLPEIGRYLNGELSAESCVAALEKQKRHLEFMIDEMKVRTVRAGDCRIEEVTVPEAVCLRTEHTARDVEDAVMTFFSAFEHCGKRKIPFAPASFHFCEFPEDVLSDGFFKTENIPMRICISVDKEKAPVDAVIYPACRALSLIFRGAYENIVAAYDRLTEHIREKGYQVCGYPREVYLQGDFDAAAEENIVRIVIPIKQDELPSEIKTQKE